MINTYADKSNIESCVGHEILFSVNCNSCIQRTQSPIKDIATLEGIDEHIFYIEAEVNKTLILFIPWWIQTN